VGALENIAQTVVGLAVLSGNREVRYRLEITGEARQQLRALSKGQRRNIGKRLDAL
jgi:hypothetical protein